MPRCPHCWTTVDALSGPCPACGARLGGRALRRGRLAALGLVGAVAVIAVVASNRGRESDAETRASPRAEPATDVTPAAAPAPPAQPADGADRPEQTPGPSPLVPVADRLAALLATARGPRLAIPDDAFLEQAQPAPVGAIVHHDARAGLVLAELDGRPPGAPVVAFAAARAGAAQTGTAVIAIDARGARLETRVAARAGDGTLQLADAVPSGCALLEAGGERVIALVVDRGVATPLDGLLPWLDTIAQGSGEGVRAAVRARDPRARLQDLDRLLAQAAPDPAELLVIVEAIEAAGWYRGTPLHERARSLAAAGRAAHAALLAGTDPAAARRAAELALGLYADDPLALETGARVEAVHGDARLAADRLERLLALAPERARGTSNLVVDAVLRAAATALDAGDAEGARALASRAGGLAPARTDARVALARALAALGRTGDALATLEPIAATDAAARQLAEQLARTGEPGSVEVPIDPISGTARTTARIGGVALRVLVDTGASATTIPVAVARQLGLLGPDAPAVEVTTASGTVVGHRVTLPLLEIGSLRLRSVTAIAMDLPGDLRSDGLLGMTALRELDVQVDGARGVIRLATR
ncbi:MAG: retroviral-like aspartic protease family protein [Planctomycetes bacterium]|nr:retroviral-like aspartic protease family protein [Planctomycetota bacterium]